MSTHMRAKFQVNKVEVFGSHEVLTFQAVCPPSFDPDGMHEDSSFARWTPTANASLTVTNPNLFGQFKQGDKFYVDFTPAED